MKREQKLKNLNFRYYLKSFDQNNRGVIPLCNYISSLGITGYQLQKEEQEILEYFYLDLQIKLVKYKDFLNDFNEYKE